MVTSNWRRRAMGARALLSSVLLACTVAGCGGGQQASREQPAVAAPAAPATAASATAAPAVQAPMLLAMRFPPLLSSADETAGACAEQGGQLQAGREDGEVVCFVGGFPAFSAMHCDAGCRQVTVWLPHRSAVAERDALVGQYGLFAAEAVNAAELPEWIWIDQSSTMLLGAYEGGAYVTLGEHRDPGTVAPTDGCTGALAAQPAAAALAARAQAVQRCYERELEADPKLAGQAVVGLRVDKDGRATVTHVESKIPGPRFRVCLAAALSSLVMAPPEGGECGDVSAPFNFTPAQAGG